MLTCREIANKVTDYLDDSVSTMTKMEFKLHVLMCKNCRIHLKKMLTLINSLEHLPGESNGATEYLASRNGEPAEKNID